MTDESTTLQGQATDVNTALDLPHGALRAVQVDRFAHGYRITGPGFTTNSGMNETQAAAFLAGMLAAIEAGSLRDA